MKALSNKSIKLLFVGFLFASSGLLQADNTITNQTGKSITVKYATAREGVGLSNLSGSRLVYTLTNGQIVTDI